MDAIGITLGVTLLLLIAVGGTLARAAEKRAWNNGICRENGLAWECFDMASDGSRGYKTRRRVSGDDDHRVVWISYGVDKPPAETLQTQTKENQ